MLNHMTRTLTRLSIATLFLAAMSLAALAQTPSPTPINPVTAQPTPTTPIQDPNFPDIKRQPLPPMPDLRRVGIIPSNVLSLSLNDAIRRALQNNNDIEVARDDVRVAEQRLLALYGFYDPVFAITPSIDHRVSPVTSIFAGGGTTGQVSNTSIFFSPSLSKSFEKGGGSYQVQFNNSRTSTGATNSTLNPFYSSNLTFLFNQPLLRNRTID